MKKLAFFFIILISLVVIAGCNNSNKKVTRFTTEKTETVETTKESDTKTTITKLDEKKVEPTPITIPDKKEDLGEFTITSLKGSVMETTKGYHLIQGTTPKNTDKILVNGYALNKYKSGNTEWSYVAAVSLGTLKKGANNYTIKALDNKRKEIASKSFTIVYNGVEKGILAPTGNSLTFSFIITMAGLLGFYSIRRRYQN